MDVSESYTWLIETIDGKQTKKFNEDGSVNKWQDINPNKIIRFSFRAIFPNLKNHEVFIDIDKGNKFIKYFSRGFLKQKDNFALKQYVFCVVTKQFRVYVNQNGEIFVTPFDYEMRL